MSNPKQSLSLVLPIAKTDITSGEVLYNQQVNQVVAAATQYGPTTSRPTANLYIGRPYFDTTLNSTVTWNGTSWSSAVGAGFTVTPDSFIYGNGTGVVASIAATNGQVLIGNTGGIPTAATLTGGTGITIGNGAGAISVTNTGVTSLVAGTGISLSGTTGAVTISNTATTTFNAPLTMMYSAFAI